MVTHDPLSYLSYGENHAGGYCDGIAYDLQPAMISPAPPSKRNVPVLIYASLATPDTHAGQFAQPRGTRKTRVTLWPQGINIELPTQLRYGCWTKPLQGDLTHLLLAHPASIATSVAPYTVFYLVRPPGDSTIPHDPPLAFYEFLNRTTTIPMKPSWTHFLWTLMCHEHWITLCPGYRSHILRCAPDHPVLLTRIQDAIRARLLT